MNYNGRQIVQNGIVTGEIPEENIQPNGVDLNVIDFQRVIGNGHIPQEGRTLLPMKETVQPIDGGHGNMQYHLEPGIYEVTFQQGCKIPSGQRMNLIHRSSVARNGGQIVSSMFDSGFETDNIGTTIKLNVPVIIDYGARICQAYCTSVNEVAPEDMYNGQWQRDSQRVDGRERIDSN